MFQHYGYFREHVMKQHPRCELCHTPWVNEDDIDIHMNEKHSNVDIQIATSKLPEDADEVNRMSQTDQDMRKSLTGGHCDPHDPAIESVLEEVAYTGEDEEAVWARLRKTRLIYQMKTEHKDYYTPRYYESLGECYVHGMIDGEAIAVQNNEGLPTQIFELR